MSIAKRLAAPAVALLGLALIGAGAYLAHQAPRVPAVALEHSRLLSPAAGAQPGAPSLQDRLLALSPYAQTHSAPPRPGQARRGTWIQVPAVGIDLPLEPGDGTDRIPDWEALVYPGTAWPGQPGNSYVYAHGLWGMFGGLLLADRGDHVFVRDYTSGRVQDFVITRIVGKVAYNDMSWVEATSATPQLTLQTCIGWDLRGDRWIVIAKPAGGAST